MMMKLSLLALSISISNAVNCNVNTQLSNTCGSIKIANVNNKEIDGTYNRIDDGLFAKEDGSRTITYWLGEDDNGNPTEYYLGNIVGDRRCSSRSKTHFVRIEVSDLDNIDVGDVVEFTPDFPSDREIQVTCLTESGVSAPAPAPETVSGVGSICLSTEYTGTVNGMPLSQLAGQYIEIDGGLNGKPAYELVNSGADCNAEVTFMYVPNLTPPYVFASNPDKPTNTFIFGCDNGDEIAANDITGCVGNIGDLVKLEVGSNCQCGLTEPTPTPIEPVAEEDLGNLCLSTTFTGQLTPGSGIGKLYVKELAGQYKELSLPVNGKKAYELVSSCGKTVRLVYYPGYDEYMFVEDSTDVPNTYYFGCSNNDDIASGIVNGLCSGNLQSILKLTTITQGMGCVCGLS